jgi:hypothetical protein
MVMLESGVSWISPYLWRLHKFWRGVRMETPWVDRAPLELVRSNIRFSLQPFDAPPEPETLIRLFDHMQSDELAYSPRTIHTGSSTARTRCPRASPRSRAQDHDRQSACDLSPPDLAAARGGKAMNIQFRESTEAASP